MNLSSALAVSTLLLLWAAPARSEEKAVPKAAPKTVQLSVTEKGFEPSPVTLKKGEPVKLVVTRKTDQTCATEIVIPEYEIQKELPLGKPVEIAFTPKKSGEVAYGCGMGM